MGIRLGPVTNGLKNSPTGSKNLNDQILATRLVIASTGAMLIVGHEAPCRFAALACRIESRITLAKGEDSRQVSGTSDASKTQLGLIRMRPAVLPRLLHINGRLAILWFRLEDLCSMTDLVRRTKCFPTCNHRQLTRTSCLAMHRIF